MSNSHSQSLTPSDIARVALKRLGELGLPPTPDNYVKFYNAIATIKSPSDKSDAELKSAYQVLFRVSDILEGVSDTTAALLTDLQRGGESMSQSLDALRGTQDSDKVLSLLGDIIGSTGSVFNTVTASHRELQDLKASMDKIQSELAVNHKVMERDPLTGALNRQGLEHSLAREVKRSRRAACPMSIALVDLDEFQRVNEQYGHLIGDKVLMHFSSIAKAVLRESDFLVRYAGAEFLLILPETDINGARFLVDRLSQVNAKTAFSHQHHRLEVRFSSGVAQLKPDENGHAMLLRAENALLKAKSAGRDQVVLAD